MKFHKVTHVIFDLDGLVLESESTYDRIINEIAHLYGKSYEGDVKLKVLGTPEKVTCAIVVRELGLPITPEEFYTIYKKKVLTEFGKPELLPGAERLIRHLHKHDIPIAVATSSSQESFDVKTKEYADLFRLFNHIVCGSTDPDVKQGKPAPDIFLVCASRFPDEPKPSQCLVFEDAPNGVVGAIKAGMQAVMVPERHVTDELRKPATVVLDSLEDFKPEWFGLHAF